MSINWNPPTEWKTKNWATTIFLMASDYFDCFSFQLVSTDCSLIIRRQKCLRRNISASAFFRICSTHEWMNKNEIEEWPSTCWFQFICRHSLLSHTSKWAIPHILTAILHAKSTKYRQNYSNKGGSIFNAKLCAVAFASASLHPSICNATHSYLFFLFMNCAIEIPSAN